MPQDKASGRAAVKYGHDMAKRVAKFLGASLLSESSNEATLGNEHIVIKSARQRTPAIGLSRAMLKRVQTIVTALQNSNGTYTLYRLDPKWYVRYMVHSRSGSPSAQKVMMVQCKIIRTEGHVIGIMP